VTTRSEKWRLNSTQRDLWPPCVIGQAIIFLPYGFYHGYKITMVSIFFLSFYPFFLAKSQRPQIRCLPYFHTWCGPSANLECRSEMCLTRLPGNTGRNKSPFWHNHTTLSDYIFGTKTCIDNRKLDGCIVCNAHNTVLGIEALLIYNIVPVCYVKTGRYGNT